MDRSYLAGAAGAPPAAPGSPSVGYPTNGNPGTGTPATQPGAYFFHMLVEEFRNVVADGGITPDAAVLTQVRDAIRVMAKSVVGSQIGYARSEAIASYSTTNIIPADNTIPQNTEGDEYTQIATAYTPKFASSLIEVEVFIPDLNLISPNRFIGALFQDAGANAIAACSGFDYVAAGSGADNFYMKSVHAAGSTAARTYKFRFGGDQATGVSFGTLFSTVRKAYMIVREIKQ